MAVEYISKEVEKLKKKYGNIAPFQLCREMDISLVLSNMGLGSAACKGFYLLQSRKQAIVINSNLSEEMQRIILMHEIAHSVLHRKALGVRAFHDFVLFDETSLFEYEANIFAADYLMEDEEVISLLNEDISFFEAASRLNVPAELLDFKFRVLKRKGYKVIDPPLTANSDFLKEV